MPSFARNLITKLLRLWVNWPDNTYQRLYRACLILRKFRPDEHTGLCRNIFMLTCGHEDTFPEHNIGLAVSLAIKEWPTRSPASLCPVPPMGYRLLGNTFDGAVKAYSIAGQCGDLYNMSTAYARARMMLLDHMIKYFEAKWLRTRTTNTNED